MSTVEVDARELANLQRLARSGQIADTLLNSPEHGMKLKEIVKAAYPSFNLPEVDIAKSLDARAIAVEERLKAKESEIDARIASFETKQREREEQDSNKVATETFEREVEMVKRTHGFTDEGMKKVFARMSEKNNPDIEAAALWVKAKEPKSPIQNNFTPSHLDPYGAKTGAKEWELLNRDPARYFDEVVAEVLNDPSYYN